MKLRIRESMDQSIPSWLKPAIAKLAKQRDTGKWGRDRGPGDFARKVNAATTTYTPMSIPRTAQEFNKIRKDPNQVTVVKLHDDYGNEIIWLPGYYISGFSNWGTTINGKRKDDNRGIEAFAAKDIIPNIDEYGYLTVDPEGLSSLRIGRSRKPDDRTKHAQYMDTRSPKGDYWDEKSGNLQGPVQQIWKTQEQDRVRYDKSGYPIEGIEKYKRMLADMGVDNAAKLIDDAYDLYVELSSRAKLARGKYQRSVFRSINNNFIEVLGRLEDAYEEYLRSGEEESRYGVRWSRNNVADYLKEIRKYIKTVREFIKHTDAGDWTDDDWSNFNWRYL